MLRSEKERVVEQLAERLRSTETLMVADYRGLTMPEIDELRSRLLEAGARFTVVKNTLTKRAAEQAGTTDVLQLIDGPTAIAFLEAEGDPVAVAKVLNEAARANEVLVIRGGVLEGKPMSADEVESLAKVPPVEILRGQVLGAIVAPLTSLIGLVTAPLTNLVGLVDARIEQLGGEGAVEAAPEAQPDEPAAEDEAPVEPAAEAADGPGEETTADATASASEQTSDQPETKESE
jgi:large subunit ribosomal protein L10